MWPGPGHPRGMATRHELGDNLRQGHHFQNTSPQRPRCRKRVTVLPSQAVTPKAPPAATLEDLFLPGPSVHGTLSFGLFCLVSDATV